MDRARQAELLGEVRETIGEFDVFHPGPNAVEIVVPDKHYHGGLFESAKKFSFRGTNIIEAAEEMLKHAGEARDGALCFRECPDYLEKE